MKSWHDGFNSAALGVGVLVGEYYIFSKGFALIKRRVEKIASQRGMDCWVVLQRTQSIVYKNPKAVTQAQRTQMQWILFLHIVVLIVAAVLWMALVVGLGMLLFNFNRE